MTDLKREDLAQLKALVETIDNSPIGKALGILAELAEEGLEARRKAKIVGDMHSAAELADEDRLIGPQRIEEILGASWRHCRQVLIPQYGEDITGSGRGKGTRYRLSDIYLIRDRIVGAEEPARFKSARSPR